MPEFHEPPGTRHKPHCQEHALVFIYGQVDIGTPEKPLGWLCQSLYDSLTEDVLAGIICMAFQYQYTDWENHA